jgi:hypothetical protein
MLQHKTESIDPGIQAFKAIVNGPLAHVSSAGEPPRLYELVGLPPHYTSPWRRRAPLIEFYPKG